MIHQSVEMIHWNIENIKKYNKDLNYAIIIHFNNVKINIDERTLPDNVFLSTNAVYTERDCSRLIYAMVQNFKTLKERLTCDYICLLSSGSGFFLENFITTNQIWLVQIFVMIWIIHANLNGMEYFL